MRQPRSASKLRVSSAQKLLNELQQSLPGRHRLPRRGEVAGLLTTTSALKNRPSTTSLVIRRTGRKGMMSLLARDQA